MGCSRAKNSVNTVRSLRRKRGIKTLGRDRKRRSIVNGVSKSKVSDKLEALKNLIPSSRDGEVLKPDQIFQETADYIVLLRTQVVVLQRLIEFYGSSSEKKEDAVRL